MSTRPEKTVFAGIPTGMEERRLLLAVLEASVAAITLLDVEGRIYFANDRAERILGLEKDQILARDYNAPEWKITALDGGPFPDECKPFRIVMDTRRPVSDVRHAIEWPDGRRRALSICGEPILDANGEVVSAVFAVADITEELESKEALRDSEERLRLALEAARMGVWSLDLVSSSFRWSEHSAGLFGFDPEGAPDTVEDYLGLVHPDDVARVDAAIREAIESGGNFAIEHRVVRADGCPYWIAIRGRADPARGMTGTVIDVTEQRLLAEQLDRSSRLESMGRLAGGVAHDFNNLLTAITGATELARGEVPPDSTTESYLELVLEAAERAAALTRRLMAFAGQESIHARPIDLSETLRRIRDLLPRLIPEDVEIVWEIAPDLWPIEADPTQVEQLLLNLAINSRDAMPGGGRLGITVRNDASESIHLSVQDTGIGIAEENLERIFDAFFTTKPVGLGTGLGLAVCKDVVDAMGGTIEVSSERGRGTTFDVRVPRSSALPSPAVADPEPREEHPAPAGRETVLVAEDDPNIRKVLERSLTALGYRVLMATDGTDALETALQDAGSIDLLLTDVVMPHLGGLDLAERLRVRWPDLRVVLISGYQGDGELEGADSRTVFLRKPFSIRELARVLRQLFERPSLAS